ncbi:hypothetical protein PR048_033174 [Dryococelus australis]|uniref:DNA-directed DNA polymerase n=1 Tax=Dryococelus australis TaxID=614101 RepID=A0ABQ9FZI0_9NEOP|nr:hypothetical protein PR048_033174 [Dryococelus australis]
MSTATRSVPYKLTGDVKAHLMETSGDVITICDQPLTFLPNTVIRDETCTEKNSFGGETSSVQNRSGNRWNVVHRRPRQQNSKVNAMLIAFYDNDSIINKEIVSAGETALPELHTTGVWMLLHDNAPVQRAIRVHQSLAERQCCKIPTPTPQLGVFFCAWGKFWGTKSLELFSSHRDLAPDDLFLSPRLKSVLEGAHIATAEAIRRHVTLTRSVMYADVDSIAYVLGAESWQTNLCMRFYTKRWVVGSFDKRTTFVSLVTPQKTATILGPPQTNGGKQSQNCDVLTNNPKDDVVVPLGRKSANRPAHDEALASHQNESGSIPGAPGRCYHSAGLLGYLPLPLTLRSGAAPYSPRFTLIGSQDTVVKTHPNICSFNFTRKRIIIITHQATVHAGTRTESTTETMCWKERVNVHLHLQSRVRRSIEGKCMAVGQPMREMGCRWPHANAQLRRELGVVNSRAGPAVSARAAWVQGRIGRLEASGANNARSGLQFHDSTLSGWTSPPIYTPFTVTCNVTEALLKFYFQDIPPPRAKNAEKKKFHQRANTPHSCALSAVAGSQWLDCSPPTQANQVRFPAGSRRDFRMWEPRAERCRLTAGFLGYIPPSHSDAAPYSHSFSLIGSQDLNVKSCPDISTPLQVDRGLNGAAVLDILRFRSKRTIRATLIRLPSAPELPVHGEVQQCEKAVFSHVAGLENSIYNMHDVFRVVFIPRLRSVFFSYFGITGTRFMISLNKGGFETLCKEIQ